MGGQGDGAAPADDLARELLADLLHDAARHPAPGFDAGRCRRMARDLRDGGPGAPVATAQALALVSVDGPHRWAWTFWAARLVAGEDRRRQARRMLEQWTGAAG